MTYESGPHEDFERHPDIRVLQGVDGLFHPSLQAKLDLLEVSPTLVTLADVPVGSTLRIRSLSAKGAEEEVRFRRNSDQSLGGKTREQWVLLKPEGDTVVEEQVNMFGACMNPTGTTLEYGNPGVRKYAHFAYAVVYPVRFRHGSEVPDTPFAEYRAPEEQLVPDILRQHLAEGWVFQGSDGALYYNEIDYSKPGAGEYVTGEVFAAEVESPRQ